jgi:glycosyltransferase involved in cell wall biosynthesis
MSRTAARPTTHAGPSVLLVTPNLDVGGAQETVRTLAARLPGAGCPTVVCSFEDGPLRADIEALGIPVELLSPRRHGILSVRAFASEMHRYRGELLDLIARHGIGVVQTQGLGTMDFLVMTLRRRRGPQVWWTIQNANFELRREQLASHTWLFTTKRAAHRLLYRVGAGRVDGVIVVSEDTKASFDAIAGHSDKVVVVCNAVDVDRYPVEVDRGALRRELGIEPGRQVITSVGTFKRQKGHRYLIEAMADLAPDLPDLHLLLVGDGELRPAIEADVRARGLDDRVSFLGTRRDVDRILAVSDVFVLASLWEGLPLALVEAMASGLPVVATEVSGTREVVVDGTSGLLVPPEDPGSLASAIRRVEADPDAAASLASEGRARVTAMFTAEAQAERLAALFRKGPSA